jgi:hypothetical protein
VAQCPLELDAITAQPGIKNALTLRPSRGPFVIYGDVHLLVGQLSGDDVMESAMSLENSGMRDLEILYVPSARGPRKMESNR